LRTNIGNIATLDDAVAALNPTERRRRKMIIRVRPRAIRASCESPMRHKASAPKSSRHSEMLDDPSRPIQQEIAI